MKKIKKWAEKFDFKWFDWILMPLGVLSIFSYLFFSNGLILKENQNILSSILFTLVNLVFTFYFSGRISLFSTRNQYLENQKKAAKKSILNLRASGKDLDELILIVNKMESNIKDDVIRQNFKELNDVIRFINRRIYLLEFDFKDLVGEDYDLENSILVKNESLEAQIRTRENEIQNLKNADQSKEDKIKELTEKVDKLKKEYKDNMGKLPFGYPSSSAPTSTSASFGVYALPEQLNDDPEEREH